jgi:hypothetical protein
MKKGLNKLPNQIIQPLYQFLQGPGFIVTTTSTSGDTTNTTSTVLTTTHIWQK